MSDPMMSDTTDTQDTTRPDCAVCGVSPHRYGTSDPHHKYDAMACVNSLRPLVIDLQTLLAECREELAKHGWGDFHYGDQGQDQNVKDMLAKIDKALDR